MRCKVLRPHARHMNGVLTICDPLVCDVLEVPAGTETMALIEGGYIECIEPPEFFCASSINYPLDEYIAARVKRGEKVFSDD